MMSDFRKNIKLSISLNSIILKIIKYEITHYHLAKI